MVRPGITRLARLVATAREPAPTATLRRLPPLLPPTPQAWLASLLIPEPRRGRPRLAWRRQAAPAHAASQMLLP
jgi:hypothetical protein